MAHLPSRPLTFSNPEYAGQIFIRTDSNDNTQYLIDEAVPDRNGSLSWAPLDPATEPRAKAALKGYTAASQYADSKSLRSGSRSFRAGEFTLHQFRQFVANDTARRVAQSGESSSVGIAHCAKQALLHVLDVVSRPLPNAVHALNQEGLFCPRSKEGFDLARQAEVQLLISKATESGGIPGVLDGYQNGKLSDRDYGEHVGKWLANDKPWIIPFLTEGLSKPITDYLRSHLNSPAMQRNGQLAQAFIGFQRGAQVSAVERRLQNLQKPNLSADQALGATFRVSSVTELIPHDSARVSSSESRLVDSHQLAQMIAEKKISSAVLSPSGDEPVLGMLSSEPEVRFAEDVVKAREWIFVEEVSGAAVTPHALAGLCRDLDIQLRSDSNKKPTMRMS